MHMVQTKYISKFTIYLCLSLKLWLYPKRQAFPSSEPSYLKCLLSLVEEACFGAVVQLKNGSKGQYGKINTSDKSSPCLESEID